MNYRDDREALHHRVNQLEDELRDARRDGEAESAERIAALEKKLSQQQAELARLRGDSPARSGRAVIAVLLGLLLGAGLLSAPFAPRRSPPPPVPVPIQTAIVPTAIDPAPPPPVPPLPVPPATPRSTTARWNAKVT